MEYFYRYFIALLVACLLWQCTAEVIHPDPFKIDHELKESIKHASPDGTLEHFIMPSEQDLSAIPQDPRNPLTPVKVSLGMYLFYETGIALTPNHGSGKGTYSCASCHIPESGFKPGRIQGIADGGMGFGYFGDVRVINPDYQPEELDIQGTRPLSMLNVAYVKNTFWNGQFGSGDANEGTEHLWNEEDNTTVNALGYEALEGQNIEGIELHRMLVDKDVADSLGYTSMFDLAFPEFKKEERYSNLTASLALSAYLRQLLSNQAPFQDWLKGDYQALSYEEKEGALLFFGKAGCYNCHYEKNLGSNTFHALGVNNLNQTGSIPTAGDAKKNLGRGGFTKDEADYHKFKVPQLYNLKDAGPYFHGSSKQTLEQVVDYFNEAEKENEDVPQSQISTFFKPLYLTQAEKDKLIAFLREGLYDGNIDRYVPPYVLSGNCFPNNDDLAKDHTGCDD